MSDTNKPLEQAPPQVEEQVDPTQTKASLEEILALAQEIRRNLSPMTQEEINDWLYDDRGLPH